MGNPITVNIKMVDGAVINVTNTEGWESMMLNLVATKAIVSNGLYLPLDKIMHITPAPLIMPTVKDGNVIFMGKQPEPQTQETPPTTPDATPSA